MPLGVRTSSEVGVSHASTHLPPRLRRQIAIVIGMIAGEPGHQHSGPPADRDHDQPDEPEQRRAASPDAVEQVGLDQLAHRDLARSAARRFGHADGCRERRPVRPSGPDGRQPELVWRRISSRSAQASRRRSGRRGRPTPRRRPPCRAGPPPARPAAGPAAGSRRRPARGSSRTWLRCLTNSPRWKSSVDAALVVAHDREPGGPPREPRSRPRSPPRPRASISAPFMTTVSSTSPWIACQIHLSRSSSSRKTPRPMRAGTGDQPPGLEERGQRMQPAQLGAVDLLGARHSPAAACLTLGGEPVAQLLRDLRRQARDLRVGARGCGHQRDGGDSEPVRDRVRAHLDHLHTAVRDDGQPAEEPAVPDQQVLLALGVAPRRRRSAGRSTNQPSDERRRANGAATSTERPPGRVAARTRARSPRASTARRPAARRPPRPSRRSVTSRGDTGCQSSVGVEEERVTRTDRSLGHPNATGDCASGRAVAAVAAGVDVDRLVQGARGRRRATARS